MLKAAKNSWFESLFAVYNSNLLRRRFHSFRIKGISRLSDASRTLPLIIYANHSSWWDGLAAFQISRKAGLDAYLMMEERQLRKYFLFRKLGVFSVVREDPREALLSMRYGAGLIENKPGTALWMFPQGEIVPFDRRPLGFYGGIGKMAKITGECALFPVALRYEFEGEFKPSLYAAVGRCETRVSAEGVSVAALEDSMEELMDSLGSDIVSQEFEGYKDLIIV